MTFQATGAAGAVQYQTANVTATYGAQSVTALLGIDSLRVTMLRFSPSLIVSGQTSSGTVFLSGSAPAGGLVVTVTCNNASLAMPSSITIPAGLASGTFAVTANASAPTLTAQCAAWIPTSEALAKLDVVAMSSPASDSALPQPKAAKT